MGAAGGPNMAEDGLVFYYDTGNGKSNKGEPTTNILSHITEFNNWSPASNSGTNPSVTANTSLNPLGLSNAPMADKVYIPDDGTYPRIYQTFTPASTNTHTFSVWIRSLSGNCDCFLGAFRNSPWSLPGSSVKSITSEWQRFSFSWTPADTTTHQIYMGSHDTSAQKGNTLEFWGAQMEEKSHATQLTLGTRSVSGSLLDFTGNSTIDLSNVSFDSNAQMTFDGTDDYIRDTTITLPSGNSPRTLEAIVKSHRANNANNADHIVNYGAGAIGQAFGFMIHQGTKFRFYGHGGSYDFDSNVTADTNWHHHCLTHDGTTIKYYLDGALVSSQPRTLNTGSSNLTIGHRPDLASGNNSYVDVPVTKLYNKALTAEEVKSNFNGIRSRFGI